MTRPAIALAVALVAALVALRASAGALPEAARLAAAWLALLVLPALLFAALRPRVRAAIDAAAVGAAESLAVFSAGAAAVAGAGGGLALFTMLHPAFVGAWAAVLIARARNDAPVAAPLDPPRGAPARVRLLRAGGIALCAMLLGVGLVRLRAPDFRMDVYYHADAAARMAARDRIESHEIGDGGESARPDPRKGTWNTLLAAAAAASGAPPLVVWNSATIAATIFGALAFARVAREFLGGAWPLGALFLIAAHEGGPGGAWFARSAYPGVVGGFLYAVFLAETLAVVRGVRSARATAILLGAALPLVHLLAGLLGLLALAALAAVLWLGCPTLPESRRAPVLVLFVSALLIAGISLWRCANSGPSQNPIQSEIQGVLFLTRSIFVPEPRTILERLGLAGCLGVLGAAALAWRARRDVGTAWLVALTALAALLVSPILATPIGTYLSYLLRRVPQLPLLPLVAAVAAAAAYGAARMRRGRQRAIAVLGAAILAIAPATSIVRAVRLAAHPAAAAQPAEACEAEWTPDLVAIAARLPATARVATDPITSYALYARSIASPLVLPDQHSPPTDSAAATRLADLARVLSPWTARGERRALLVSHRVTHLLVNSALCGAIPTYGYPVSAENARRLAEQLAQPGSDFEILETSGALSLFRFEPGRTANSIEAPPPRNPFLAAQTTEPRPSRVATSAGLFLIEPRVETTTAAAGERIVVACVLERGGAPPPLGEYVAYLSITSEERAETPGRFAKVLRGRSDRVVFERMIARGEYPVLLWSAGESIADRYFIRIPRDFAPGRYVVAMDIQRVPFFQNRTLAGLLGDRDEYSRVRVGAIEVTLPVSNS